jgi:hypothetical protein
MQILFLTDWGQLPNSGIALLKRLMPLFRANQINLNNSQDYIQGKSLFETIWFYSSPFISHDCNINT